jgi:WD40 repeat protein
MDSSGSGGNSQFKAMCYIPGDILATVSDDNVLRLWELLLYKKMPTYFENIECAYQNSMKMLDNKTLLVGSVKGFVVIDLRFMAVIQRVTMEDELCNVNSFVILNSGYFITGSEKYFYLYEYNINEAKLLLKTPNNHSDCVGVVVKQNAKHFVSGGFDSVIKVWEIVYDE